ncbi:MAG: hydrogen gas-evolving membrane-bound hydrogenase subunit E [Clostridia bacterium]
MRKKFTFLILSFLLMILISSLSEMPPLGDITNPSYNQVAKHYNENAVEETNILNIISSIITDYRAFDTLGETTVLFTSITAVVSVLSIGFAKHEEDL